MNLAKEAALIETTWITFLQSQIESHWAQLELEHPFQDLVYPQTSPRLIFLAINPHLLQVKTQAEAKAQSEETHYYLDHTTTDLITTLVPKEVLAPLNTDTSRARNNFYAHYLKMQQVRLKISISSMIKSKKKLKLKMKQEDKQNCNYKNNIEILF